MVTTFSKQLFALRVNENFQVGGPEPITLKLVECQGAAIGNGFQLTFVGPMSPVLPQAIYALSNEILGEVAIFIVPSGPVPEGMGYEAVFN